MKFSIALSDLESMLSALLPRRERKTDTFALYACAARVFVASGKSVIGMESLVFSDGGVRLPTRVFREVLQTYKSVGVLVFEGGPGGLRVQNLHMPVLAYEPSPKPPGEFQVFRTFPPTGADIAVPRIR